MQTIDLTTWERTPYFKNYQNVDLPYIIVTADLDITELYAHVKEEKLSLYFSLIYAATKRADEILNFRYRFRKDEVFCLDRNVAFATHIQPGSDIFVEVECDDYDSMDVFARHNRKKADAPVSMDVLAGMHDRLDFINFSTIPWISYSGFIRTIADFHGECNPKMTFGKFRRENGRILIPFSCQTHHGLMDGLHVGRFYENLQTWLSEKGWE